MHACASNVKNPKRAVALQASNYRTLLVPILIIVCITIVDQITKIWAVEFLSLKGSVEVLGQFLMLTLVYNEGGAMGTNFGPSIYYLITSILILLFLFYYIFAHRTHKLIVYPMSFIAGGALGNITDRIRIGKVIDWIDVDFFNANIFGYQINRWWTFNIADAAISCSILFILVTMLVTKFSHDDNQAGAAVTEDDKLPKSENS